MNLAMAESEDDVCECIPCWTTWELERMGAELGGAMGGARSDRLPTGEADPARIYRGAEGGGATCCMFGWYGMGGEMGRSLSAGFLAVRLARGGNLKLSRSGEMAVPGGRLMAASSFFSVVGVAPKTGRLVPRGGVGGIGERESSAVAAA